MKLLFIVIVTLGFLADGKAQDFSGTWKQSNEECSPKRTGDVTLTIHQRDTELVVETASKRRIARHALQRYTTDGVESKSIGADGDEVYSTVVWENDTLVFNIVEVEDGKRLKSREIWSLMDEGRRLKRLRRSEKSGEQTMIYLRK